MAEKESQTTIWMVILPILITGVFGVIVAVISNIGPLHNALYGIGNSNQAVAQSIGSPAPTPTLDPLTGNSPGNQNAAPALIPLPTEVAQSSPAKPSPQPSFVAAPPVLSIEELKRNQALADGNIRMQIQNALAAETTLHKPQINIEVKSGIVELTGSASSFGCKDLHSQLITRIQAIQGVKSVNYNLTCIPLIKLGGK